MIKIHHEDSFFKKFFKIVGIVIIVLIVLNVLSALFSKDNVFGPKVLIIPITGEISLYGNSGLFGSGGLSADEIIEQIDSANEDDDIVAIILEINTPGGTVVASEDIAKSVARSNKPVIAWMREVAASGGYWIAASADEIVADPATITGSIGVTSSYLNYAGLFDDYGIKYERLVSGPYKDTGTPYRNLTEQERRLMQSKINNINELFISHVSESRNISIPEVRKIATGEIFLGSEAFRLKLVDALGGKKVAVQAAEDLSGIENLSIIRYEGDKGFFGKLSALTNFNLNIEDSKSNLALRS